MRTSALIIGACQSLPQPPPPATLPLLISMIGEGCGSVKLIQELWKTLQTNRFPQYPLKVADSTKLLGVAYEDFPLNNLILEQNQPGFLVDEADPDQLIRFVICKGHKQKLNKSCREKC